MSAFNNVALGLFYIHMAQKLTILSMIILLGTVSNAATEKAIFAGGCFWCTEAIYQQIDGVKAVNPGYIGGTVANPSYNDVCSGTTGHAEAVEINYDPAKVSYVDLLKVFFATHDPTQLNRQGADVGTQYRSGVFYLNEAQKEAAKNYIEELNNSGKYSKLLVTEITKASTFYKAENYHQDYFERNPNQGYCQFVIEPKVSKFQKEFKDYLK